MDRMDGSSTGAERMKLALDLVQFNNMQVRPFRTNCLMIDVEFCIVYEKDEYEDTLSCLSLLYI